MPGGTTVTVCVAVSTVEPRNECARERVAVTVPPRIAVAQPYSVREMLCNELTLDVNCLLPVRAVAVEADARVIGRYVDRVARRRIQIRRCSP